MILSLSGITLGRWAVVWKEGMFWGLERECPKQRMKDTSHGCRDLSAGWKILPGRFRFTVGEGGERCRHLGEMQRERDCGGLRDIAYSAGKLRQGKEGGRMNCFPLRWVFHAGISRV